MSEATASIARSAARWLVAGLLQITAVPAPAEELGRLFLTTERRVALDRQRQFNIQETARETTEDATLSVSGIVRRSSGRDTAWINNAPQDPRAPDGSVQVQIDRTDPATASVATGEDKPARLKVGEALDRSTGETSSGIGEGRVVVKRGAAQQK